MSYVTVDELRTYLKQVGAGAEVDDNLDAILTRATSIIDGVLGFEFGAYPAASTKTLYSDGTPYLLLPPCNASSLTTITSSDGTAWVGYEVRPIRKRTWLYQLYGWPALPLTVSAAWGYGPPPASVTEVCLELAVNIWRSKDRGLFSDVIGVETGAAGALGNTGAVVGYAGALTNQQKMILSGIKRDYEAVGF